MMASKVAMQMEQMMLRSQNERDASCPCMVQKHNIKLNPPNPIGQTSYAFTITGGDMLSSYAEADGLKRE